MKAPSSVEKLTNYILWLVSWGALSKYGIWSRFQMGAVDLSIGAEGGKLTQGLVLPAAKQG